MGVRSWIWDLDAPFDPAVLSPEEHARLGRLATPLLAHRYGAARAGLRARLGALLGAPAASVALKLGQHGKPYLEDGPHFNLSHSDGLAALVVSDEAEVGLDIERVRPLLRDVAGRYFSERERASIATWPEAQRGFFALWTSKEAVMKVLGLGFRLNLSAFETIWDAGESPRLLRLDVGDASAISLQPFPVVSPATGSESEGHYLGCLALRSL